MPRTIQYSLTTLLLIVLSATVSAQGSLFTPSIQVSGQLVSGTSVVIDEIIAQRFGFIVIRADDGTGAPGGVIGLALLHPGVNRSIRVEIEMINITPTLYAIVHLDTEPYGNFQFAEVDGADSPVTVDDTIVMAEFEVAVISVHDQFVDPDNFNRIVVDTVTSSENGWLVAHTDNEGEPGAVLGHTFLEAGTSQYLPVLLSGDVTDSIHIMLHADTGEPERYEFGESENVDMPVTINNEIAMTSISTVPTLRVNDSIVIGSDLTRNQNEFVPFVADSVLSEGAGWLVIHADSGENAPGEVIGFAPVQAGFNDNVIVELPQTEITARLFPMLHSDSGEALVYEFGEVEETDLPFLYNNEIVMGSAMVIPSINADIQIRDDRLIVVSALIDISGWLVLYADDEGLPGDVLAYTPLNPSLNQNIPLLVDTSELNDTIHLILHYDSRPLGIFGLITEDGSDSPVVFDGEAIIISVDLTD